MNKSESIKNIAIALKNFQAEIKNPKNTAVNPYYNSKYAPLQDILNEVRPILAKYGLSIIQNPSGDGERVSIQTLLLHESGEWIEFDPLVLRAEKLTPQGAGIAITYGRRYSLSAVLGISSEDDDDGNSLEEREPITQKQIGLIKTLVKHIAMMKKKTDEDVYCALFDYIGEFDDLLKLTKQQASQAIEILNHWKQKYEAEKDSR